MNKQNSSSKFGTNSTNTSANTVNSKGIISGQAGLGNIMGNGLFSSISKPVQADMQTK